MKSLKEPQSAGSSLSNLRALELREWTKCFEQNCCKIVTPCIERLSAALKSNEPSMFFCLSINSIEGIFPKLESFDGKKPVQIRVSFFDMTYNSFYGRIWKGPFRMFKTSQAKPKLNYDENLYFHTPIRDTHVLVVVELVVEYEKNKEMSCGWAAFRPFATNAVKNKNSERIDFYHGTPRALLFMDEPYEENQNLQKITGCLLNFSFNLVKSHEGLKNLIPQNVFVSKSDKIGGVVDYQDPDKDNLERPKLLPRVPIVLSGLRIFLNPGVTKFEDELCKLVTEDLLLWEKTQIDPTSVQITERRLKIGVHNGWNYVHEPYVVQLALDTPQNNSQIFNTLKKRSSARSSLNKPPTPTNLKTDSDDVASLVMRSSIVINEAFDDMNCAIIFAIEYIFSVPLSIHIMKGKNVVDNKKQYKTHYVTVRWAAWSPSNVITNDTEGNAELNMFGGSLKQNPENVLVYKVPDTKMQDENSTFHAAGKISFSYKRGAELNIDKPEFERTEMKQELTDRTASKTNVQQDPRYLYDGEKFVSTNPQQLQNLQQLQTQQFQTNLLLSQLAFSAQESKQATGVFPANLELFPIKNKIPAPVVALQPGQIGGRTVSRAAYAKLQSANFPLITDRFGKVAEIIDDGVFVVLDWQREAVDPLISNEIWIQFLAFSKIYVPERNGYLQRPQSVFFTFKFYRFPEVKTPRLELDKLIEDYSTDTYSVPYILKHRDNAATKTTKTKSGLTLKYNVDASFLKYNEKKTFLQYLAYNAIFIDVWDGESLHLIGTCTLQLKDLLRQGKEAVQSTYELDILSTEYDDDTNVNSANMLKEGTPFASNSHVKLQGKLHVRFGNVGYPNNLETNDVLNSSSAPPLPLTRIVASKSALNASGTSELSETLFDKKLKKSASAILNKANHMTETFKDIHAALVSDNNRNRSDMDEGSDPQKKRKLKRMELARRIEGGDEESAPIISNQRRIIDERNKDLKVMKYFREQTKHDQIIKKLNEHITTEYCIYPSFGIIEFFEFVITNPYAEAHLVTVISNDADIQVITDAKEWKHLKQLNQIYSEIDEDLFSREGLEMNGIKCPQLYLRPSETVRIPLKFITFKADHAVQRGSKNHPALYPTEDTINMDSTAHQFMRRSEEVRRAQVDFKGQDGRSIAILSLVIEQQPHIVNQTFRFNVPENSFLKKTIRVPTSSRVLATNTTLFDANFKISGSGESGMTQVYVRSSDPNVIVDSKPVNMGEPHDIHIKTACPVAPFVKKFFVGIYADRYLSVPLHMWEVYAHSVQRIDLSSIQGQTNNFSLLLKGTQSSRLARAFPNIPEDMSVHPTENFMLPASAVLELNLAVRTLKAGVKHYYLNVVDVESHSLVNSWFIQVNSNPPVLSKAFELTLPAFKSGTVTESQVTHKRISYSNPYKAEKVFLISTNRNDLLTFKESRVRFSANETKTLALKFQPYFQTGLVEVLVFINNENDVNEETFSLRITYTNEAASTR